MEAGVDAALGDSIAAVIPGVKILEFFVKLPSSVSNELFKRSVLAFIERGDDADPEQWEELVNKLEQEEGGLDRAGDVMMRSLSNLDETKKARYLGKLYAAAARKEISIEEMYRMQMVLDRAYLHDLENWQHLISNLPVSTMGAEWLANLGVFRSQSTVMPKLNLGSQNDAVVVTHDASSNLRKTYKLAPFGEKMLKAIGLIPNT